MKKIALTATVLLILLTVQARAADPRVERVRPIVTINAAKDQNKLTSSDAAGPMAVENQQFGPVEQRPFILRAKGKETVSSLLWREYSFTFTPEKSGYVWVSLEGEYPPKDQPDLVFQVDFDTLVVIGAEIRNGDFEDAADDGTPRAWQYNAKVIPNEGQTAHSGNHFVTVTAKNRIGQAIKVTAGQAVTISFSARAHNP
jgi:hypothetical protein